LRVAITKNAKQKYTSNHMTTDEGYSRNASYALNSLSTCLLLLWVDTSSSRHGYHPPSCQYFGFGLVYYIYLLLEFTTNNWI